MEEKKKLRKYRMAVGICGPTVLYTNIIRAYSAEEAARLYLKENSDNGVIVTDEMVSEIANKMYEIEEAKALETHYDACGEQLDIGDTVLCVVNTTIVKGMIVKLTNRGVKITSNNNDYSIIIGNNDYKEINGEKAPFFAKMIKVTDDMVLDTDVEVGSFVAYLAINFGKCTGFGFGTVTRITPSYIYINTVDNDVIRKSVDKVQRLR